MGNSPHNRILFSSVKTIGINNVWSAAHSMWIWPTLSFCSGAKIIFFCFWKVLCFMLMLWLYLHHISFRKTVYVFTCSQKFCWFIICHQSGTVANVYVCVHLYLCIYCIYTYICVYVCKYIHVYMYTYVCVCIHITLKCFRNDNTSQLLHWCCILYRTLLCFILMHFIFGYFCITTIWWYHQHLI